MKKVKDKRKARKRWQQSSDPVDTNILNNLTQQLSRENKRFKDNSLNNYLTNLKAVILELLKEIKSLKLKKAP